MTLHGVTHDPTIASGGSFSTQFTGTDVSLDASSTAYTVTYAYATDGAFLAAHGSSQLTVNQAALTVSATSVSSVYGAPLPGLSYTISGFVNGDTSSVVSGAGPSQQRPDRAHAPDLQDHTRGRDLECHQLQFPRRRPDRRNADRDACTSRDRGRLDEHVCRSTRSRADGGLLGIRHRRHAGQPHRAARHQLGASPSSQPGTYAIAVGGASSSNYKISYVPGTLTVILPPATVDSVSVQKVKVGKHKTVQEIVLQFSEALDSATAQSISSYTLATVPKKKQSSKPVPISAATYNAVGVHGDASYAQNVGAEPPARGHGQGRQRAGLAGPRARRQRLGTGGRNFTAVLSKGGSAVTTARSSRELAAAAPHR